MRMESPLNQRLKWSPPDVVYTPIDVTSHVHQEGVGARVHVVRLKLGQVEVHAAEVLDLGVEGLGRVAAGLGDHRMGAVCVRMGVAAEVHRAYLDAYRGRPGVRHAALSAGHELLDGVVADLGPEVLVASRVPGSGVRGRGSGERETTASSLAGKQQAREKEDNGGQGKDGPAGAIAQGGNGR